MNLNSTWNKVIIGCILKELWYFSAAEGAWKLMKPKHIFDSPGKNWIIKIHAVFFIVLSIKSLYWLWSVAQLPAVYSEEFHFKMLSWPVRDVASYASCTSAISLPIYHRLQTCFLYRNNHTNLYIYRIISCLKGFTLGYHIPYTYWMNISLETY